MYKSLNLILFGVLFTFTFRLSAQIETFTEEDVNLEKAFIEALSKRIMGKEEEALKLLEELSAMDRRNDAVLYELARSQKNLKDEQTALETINRAIRLDPGNKWYLLFRAGVEEQMGLYKTAADTYSLIIEIDPDEPIHYYRKAENYLRINKPLEALITLNQLEEHLGSFEEVHQRKYDIYRTIGELSPAVNELRALLDLYPSNTEYLFMLASHYRQAGMIQEADSLYTLILDIDPADSRAGLALSRSTDTNESVNSATRIRSLHNILKNPHGDLDAKIIELIPYIEQVMDNHDEDMIQALIEAIKIIETAHPGEAKVHAMLADVYQLSDQYDKAIDEYKASLKYGKGVYTVWEQLQYLLLETGRFQELLDISESALDVFPNQIRFWLFNAMALRATKKFNDALSSLDQAYMMSQGNPVLSQEILSQKAAVLFDKGEISSSQKTFDEALSLKPENQIIISRQAFYLARNKESGHLAEKILNEQIINYPNNPILGGTLVYVLFVNQQGEKALETLKKLKEINPEDKRLKHLHMMILETNEQELTSFWQSVLEGLPT